jgi:hypothetical protein
MNILDVLEGKEVVYFSFRLSYCDYILATQVHSRPYTCHHIITLFYMKCYETRLLRTINVHELLICMVPHSLFIYVSGACKCHLSFASPEASLSSAITQLFHTRTVDMRFRYE